MVNIWKIILASYIVLVNIFFKLFFLFSANITFRIFLLFLLFTHLLQQANIIFETDLHYIYHKNFILFINFIFFPKLG